MFTAILLTTVIVLLIVCAFGWLIQKINTMTLLWYLQEKDVPFPSNEDMKKGSSYVVKHMLSDLLGPKRK